MRLDAAVCNNQSVVVRQKPNFMRSDAMTKPFVNFLKRMAVANDDDTSRIFVVVFRGKEVPAVGRKTAMPEAMPPGFAAPPVPLPSRLQIDGLHPATRPPRKQDSTTRTH